MLKISDVTPGKLNENYTITRFASFRKHFKDLEYISTNAEGNICHKNYMEYLAICWADHLGIVFTPDILWYSILCEIASLVKENKERYRKYFTGSNEKVEISVLTDSPTEIPMDKIVLSLKNNIPYLNEEHENTFFPTFSTSTTESIHACQVAFADIASPYYDYSMYMCGIPYVDVRGTKDDYCMIMQKLLELGPLLTECGSVWYNSLVGFVLSLLNNFESKVFWSEIFSLERCGSGGQVEVTGWWSKIYRKQPSIRYTYNFDLQLASIDYKNLSTGLNYKVYSGLIASHVENELLVPTFGNILFKTGENK